MTSTRLQPLLVLALPLLVGIATTWLLEPFHVEARGVALEDEEHRSGDEAAVDLLEVESLFGDSAVVAPLDSAAPAWRASSEALRGERYDAASPEQPLPIPEPSSGLLLAFGLAGLAARRR